MYIRMLSDYLKDEFGEKYYRISLNGGMSCPNRDGTCGTSGCVFCTESGSGEFTPDVELSINEQIETAKKLVAEKSSSDKFIAYFQAYSNTYAPVNYLKSLYKQVIFRDDIAILSIATRPDCLQAEIVNLLGELNKVKPVWVELGLQTIKESSIAFIRRGYPNAVYEKAVEDLRSVGCKVITHLILGLPDENKADMIASSLYAGKYSDGVKFHMLYVAEGSQLADEFTRNEFKMLTREEYIDVLCECIRVIPKDTVVHRLTGDPDKRILISPTWTKDKKRVLREIHNAFIDRDIIQGENL